MNDRLLKQELINSGRYYQIQKARHQAYKDNKDFFIDKFYLNKLKENMMNVLNNSLSNDIKLWYLINSKIQYRQYKITNKYFPHTFKEYKLSENIRKSRQKQRHDIKDQLEFWVVMGYKIIFNTYTINDETLQKYNIALDENIDKLQSLLTRTLAQYTDDYIGNIDYGKTTDRIHFHVLEAYKSNTTHYFKEEILKTNNFNELDLTDPFTCKNKKIDKFNDLEINELQEIKIRDKYNYQLLNINTSATTSWNSKYGFTYPELIEYNKKSYIKLPSYLAKLCSHSIKVKKKRLFKKKIKQIKEDGTITLGSEYKEYKYLREHFKDPKDIASKQKYYSGKIIIDKKQQEYEIQKELEERRKYEKENHINEMISILETL